MPIKIIPIGYLGVIYVKMFVLGIDLVNHTMKKNLSLYMV
jgi:hypothetical protein